MERFMSREGDGPKEALSSREQELRSLVETIPTLVCLAGPEGNVEFAAQLQATLNMIPAYAWYAAPSGGLTFVNKRTADYLGLPEDHPLRFGIDIGAPWDAHIPLLHPDDQEESRRAWSTCLRTGEAAEFSQRVPNAHGVYRWFLSRAEPLRASDGTLLKWVGVNLDIEELKRAQEALRESERRSRSAIDGIPGLVAVMAPNGELETVNRQIFEYFGRPLEWLKSWETNEAVHPEDLPRALELTKRGIVSGIPFSFELRIRRFDGEYRWFDNRSVPIRDDSGRIARWYVLLTDIEDRTRALARLDQMQSDFAHMNRVSMMGELAASLSHEITQPIASARNNARAAQNFLDMQPPDLGEVREALGCVVGDTDRAGDIIDRIRDHIKKAPPRKERFDLNEAIDEVIVLGRSAIIKNGVSVQTRLSEGLFAIHGDRVQLQQVVLNLLLNAVEAMGSSETGPRELLISTEQDHTVVLVAVRDSGPGIDPSHLERVFDAFYTTKSRGTGMGLSICRSIIDAHGGRLWAEANEPRGTIFQFTLPAVP
jgi:PAS domain S-box-containing protein